MKVHFSISVILAAGLFVGASPAQAQQNNFLDFTDPSITIDMSVIGDSGYAARPSGPMLATPSGRKLLIPGDDMPSSQLYIKPPSGKRLMPPKPIRMAKPAAVSPKPAPALKAIAKAPVMAPAKPKVAAPTPPKPARKKTAATQPTKLTAAAKAPAAPAKPVNLAKKSPPAMPPKPAPVKAAPKPPAKVEAKKAEPMKVSIPVPVVKTETKKTEAKPVETASIPIAGQALKVGRVLRVAFAGQGTKLPAASKPELANLAKQLEGSDKMRLQLLAYAGGDNLSSSLARRLSLSRALAVRSYLIERGVRSTRIDVRALGNKTTEQPFNRVDLNIAER